MTCKSIFRNSLLLFAICRTEYYFTAIRIDSLPKFLILNLWEYAGPERGWWKLSFVFYFCRCSKESPHTIFFYIQMTHMTPSTMANGTNGEDLFYDFYLSSHYGVVRRGQLVHCYWEAGIKVYLLYITNTFLYKYFAFSFFLVVFFIRPTLHSWRCWWWCVGEGQLGFTCVEIYCIFCSEFLIIARFYH